MESEGAEVGAEGHGWVFLNFVWVGRLGLSRPFLL